MRTPSATNIHSLFSQHGLLSLPSGITSSPPHEPADHWRPYRKRPYPDWENMEPVSRDGMLLSVITLSGMHDRCCCLVYSYNNHVLSLRMAFFIKVIQNIRDHICSIHYYLDIVVSSGFHDPLIVQRWHAAFCQNKLSQMRAWSLLCSWQNIRDHICSIQYSLEIFVYLLAFMIHCPGSTFPCTFVVNSIT